MKKHAGVDAVAGDEGFLEQHNDKDRKSGKTVFDEKKYFWPVAEVILHHRIEFPGSLGDQDQGEQPIQQAQAQDNHYADEKGWVVMIQSHDPLAVLVPPDGCAHPLDT